MQQQGPWHQEAGLWTWWDTLTQTTATTNVTWQKQKEGNDMPISQ